MREKEQSTSNPPRLAARAIVLASIGAALGIAVVAGAGDLLAVALILGSFGSTAVILFAFPEVHFAQPRHVIGGHCISSAVGVATYAVLGVQWWSIGLAVGLATAAMLLARCVHPPAGSNPIIAALMLAGWKFILLPTLAGSVLLTLVALAWHRANGQRYPLYWR